MTPDNHNGYDKRSAFLIKVENGAFRLLQAPLTKPFARRCVPQCERSRRAADVEPQREAKSSLCKRSLYLNRSTGYVSGFAARSIDFIE